MADGKQGKNQQEKNSASSEGFGFKQSPLGFDKNEVNLYINKLKKQMKEQQEEYEERLSNMRKNLEDAHDESNAAKAAAKTAQAAVDPAAIAAANKDKADLAQTQKLVEDMKKANDAKIMELRKSVLDERRNVARLDKECAMAQMSEKKIREQYAKLKEKYTAIKKSGGGAKAVLNSNADEVLDEACKIAKEITSEAKAYAKKAADEINSYKAKVEAELKARSEKLAAAKKSLDEQRAKAEAENNAAKEAMKKIADKIAAVTSQLGAFAGSFDAVNAQISEVTGKINDVTGSFGSVSKSITEASQKIDSFAQQFDGVKKQLNGAKTEFDGISGSLEAAKTSFANVTKSVDETKNGIAALRTGAEEASKLTVAPAASDTTALGAAADAISAAGGDIKLEFKLPELDESKFSEDKLEALKSKLKVETTYVGGEADDDDDDDDIISSIEVEEIPVQNEPSDEELMADIQHLVPEEVPAPAEELTFESKAEPDLAEAPLKMDEPKAEPTDDFESLFVSPTADDDMSSSIPLVNTAGVGAVEGFTLEKKPDTTPDFDLAPNDLTAAPEKGSDLGEDIFDMAINPVDADDNTLNDMLASKAAQDAMDDFMLTPSSGAPEEKPSKPAMSDDFGEFADLFAAGSAETTAPTPKKQSAAFRKPANKSDDMWNFGSEENGDDNDMSSDSDLSDLLL